MRNVLTTLNTIHQIVQYSERKIVKPIWNNSAFTKFPQKIALNHFTYGLHTCSVNFEYNLSNRVTVDKKILLHSTGTAMRKYTKFSQNIPTFKRFFIFAQPCVCFR